MSRRKELETVLLRHLLLYGRATRPELVALTGVRAATVFEKIDALKAAKIIEEPERRGKKTGRRSPELSCVPDCCHTLGVQLHSRGCIGVVSDAAGKILHSVERRADSRSSLQEIKCEILEVLQNLRDLAAEKWHLVKGIGFADPGLTDIQKNYSIGAVNIPQWQALETGKMLETASGLPSQLWPETMVKTRMEYFRHLSALPESLFNLVTDDGIGGGFIKKGELFAGNSGRAMEIGHLSVVPDGRRCSCGRRGCLETAATPAALREKVAAARAAGAKLGGLDENFSMKTFAEYLPQSKALQDIAAELFRDLGKALGAAVMLLDPEMVVISGELAQLGSLLTESLRRELTLHCFPETVRDLKIELSVPSSSLETALAAAVMMRDRILLGADF